MSLGFVCIYVILANVRQLNYIYIFYCKYLGILNGTQEFKDKE